MADMYEFGKMDVNDRGGKHDYFYGDEKAIEPSNGPTPSQTVGPFFAYGLTPGPYGYSLSEIHKTDISALDIEGDKIIIEGQVFDGNGAPIHDAVVEMIQADASGEYATAARNNGFTGYFRAGTGPNGSAEKGGDTHFRFHTIKPGSTMKGAAPFVNILITMRGLLNHCVTRAYFEGDDVSSDPVLNQVPQARRHTLIAKQVGENRFRIDFHMQGDNETVFFDI